MVTVEEQQARKIAQLQWELACECARTEWLRSRLERVAPGPERRCVYCGQPSRGRACTEHADLLNLDTAAAA